MVSYQYLSFIDKTIVHYTTRIVFQSISSFFCANSKSTLRRNLFGGNLVQVSLRSRWDPSREESFGRGAAKPCGEWEGEVLEFSRASSVRFSRQSRENGSLRPNVPKRLPSRL